MSESLRKKKWSLEDAKAFYSNLLKKALDKIGTEGASMILGPMFILRPPEENFAIFGKARADLTARGINVFDQLPFVDYNIGDAPFEYAIKFEIFYKGLIQSGKISSCYLLPDWEKSEGTVTEVNYCKEFSVPVFEI